MVSATDETGFVTSKGADSKGTIGSMESSGGVKESLSARCTTDAFIVRVVLFNDKRGK